MLNTGKFGLQKPEQEIDNVSIDVINDNMDIIDAALGNTAVFQIAGGTATAITLTGIALQGGRSKTFVVAAGNNGAATTINGKPLYKPGGTSAPKLIAGKAVTVWYDSAGDCFFIKASAEGDAVAGNVLAGKKFSNDDDTGLTGTMPDKTLAVAGITQADGYKADAGTHICVRPKEGYYKSEVDGDGFGPIGIQDTNFIPGNIAAYTSIFGKQGTFIPRVPNLLKNGQFSNQNCWDTLNSTVNSVTGNVLTFTPSAQYGRVHQRGPIIIANHKYYARIEVYGQSDAYLEFVNNSQQGSVGNHSSVLQWETLTCITALSTTDTLPGIFRVSSSLTSGWIQIKVRNAMLIDMTEAFGSGKELTATQMEVLIAAAGGYWHNTLSKLIPDTSAIASKVLLNELFYDTNGSRVVGTMPNKTFAGLAAGGVTYAWADGYKPDASISLTVKPQEGYYKSEVNGDGFYPVVVSDNNYIAKKIPAWTSIFGKQGSLGPRVPNLIKNGSFINQNCWDIYNATLNSVTGYILTFTATAQWGRIYQTCDPVIANHKYYFRAEVSGNNEAYISIIWNTTNTGIVSAYHSSTVQFETLSCIVTPNANGDMLCRPSILSQATAGWAQIKVKLVMFIDLTASFGAGFEPTQAEMDALITYTGWWNSQLPILMSDANVSAADVLAGKVFYSNAGSKLSGTIPVKTGNTPATSCGSEPGTVYLVAPIGYYDGSINLSYYDPDFVASNIANTVNIFGLTGTAKRTISGTAVASSGSQTFMTAMGTLQTESYIHVTGLTFKPRCIAYFYVSAGWSYTCIWYDSSFNGTSYCTVSYGGLTGSQGYNIVFNGNNGVSGSNMNVDATSFHIPVFTSGVTCYWFAIE